MVKVGDTLGGLRVVKVSKGSGKPRGRRGSGGTVKPKEFEKPEDLRVGSAVRGDPDSIVDVSASELRRSGGSSGSTRQRVIVSANVERAKEAAAIKAGIAAAILRDGQSQQNLRGQVDQGTVSQMDNYQSNRPIYTDPYIEKRVIDYTKDNKYRDVPITQTVYVDPTGEGKQKERAPTPAERKAFDDADKQLVIVKEDSKLKRATTQAMGFYETANIRLRESISEPLLGWIDAEQQLKNTADTNLYLEEQGVPKVVRNVGSVSSALFFGTIKDYQENPLTNVIIDAATLGVGAAVVKGARAARLTKVGRYVSKPSVRVTQFADDIADTTRVTQRTKPQFQFSQIDDATETIKRTDVIAKNKGTETVREYFPGGTKFGKVTEVRGGKEYIGQASVGTGGQYREVVDFGKVVRVTEKLDDTGDATVKLFKKNGREIYSGKVGTDDLLDLGKGTSKTSKTKIDKNIKATGEITDIDLKLQDNRLITNTADDLQSKKIFGEIAETTTEYKNPKKGAFKIETTQEGYVDIIKSTPRKGSVEIKTAAGRVKLKKRVGQAIEFGEDRSRDVKDLISTKDRFQVKQYVAPTINREVTELAGRETIIGYVNPKSKVGKKWAGEFMEKVAESKRLRKKGDIFGQVIDENEKIQDAAESVIKVTKVADDIVPTSSGNQIQILKTAEKTNKVADKLVKEATTALPVLEDTVYVTPTRELVKARSVTPTTFDAPSINFGVNTPATVAVPGMVLGTYGVNYDQKYDVKVKTMSLDKVDVATPELKLDTKLDVKTDTMALTAVAEDTKIRSRSKARQDNKPILDVKLDTKTETKITTKMKAPQRTRTDERVRTPRPDIPKTFFPKLPKIQTPGTSKPSTKQALTKLYTVYAKEKGVDVKIGTAKTKKAAFQKLSKKLKKDISASGFVESKGKKIKPLSYGSEFRKSKVDPFRVVQKKEKRLGTKTETSQIQYFKKSSPAKKKKGFF